MTLSSHVNPSSRSRDIQHSPQPSISNIIPTMNRQLPEGGQTLVYSTVGDHEIKLDYYLPRANGALPAVIYYHGGGMTAGSRRGGGLPHWLFGE